LDQTPELPGIYMDPHLKGRLIMKASFWDEIDVCRYNCCDPFMNSIARASGVLRLYS
jgi:hypothetical protein